MISTVAFSDPVKQLLPKLVRILDVLVTVGCMNCVWMCNLTKGGRGIKIFCTVSGNYWLSCMFFFMSLNQDNSNDPILAPDLVNSLCLEDFIGIIEPLLGFVT